MPDVARAHLVCLAALSSPSSSPPRPPRHPVVILSSSSRHPLVSAWRLVKFRLEEMAAGARSRTDLEDECDTRISLVQLRLASRSFYVDNNVCKWVYSWLGPFQCCYMSAVWIYNGLHPSEPSAPSDADHDDTSGTWNYDASKRNLKATYLEIKAARKAERRARRERRAELETRLAELDWRI